MKIIKEPFMQLQPEHFISVTFETERSATEAQLNPTIHDAAETYIGNVNSQIFHVSTCHS